MVQLGRTDRRGLLRLLACLLACLISHGFQNHKLHLAQVSGTNKLFAHVEVESGWNHSKTCRRALCSARECHAMLCMGLGEPYSRCLQREPPRTSTAGTRRILDKPAHSSLASSSRCESFLKSSIALKPREKRISEDGRRLSPGFVSSCHSTRPRLTPGRSLPFHAFDTNGRIKQHDQDYAFMSLLLTRSSSSPCFHN